MLQEGIKKYRATLLTTNYKKGIVVLEDRITELEIKFSHQDQLVDELNKIILNQQMSIDKLINEIQNLKISIEGNAGQVNRTLEDDVPPHY